MPTHVSHHPRKRPPATEGAGVESNNQNGYTQRWHTDLVAHVVLLVKHLSRQRPPLRRAATEAARQAAAGGCRCRRRGCGSRAGAGAGAADAGTATGRRLRRRWRAVCLCVAAVQLGQKDGPAAGTLGSIKVRDRMVPEPDSSKKAYQGTLRGWSHRQRTRHPSSSKKLRSPRPKPSSTSTALPALPHR